MSLDPSAASRLKEALATVVVIPVTPMRPDGSLEWGTYADLVRRVVDAGITVVTANGNTGEFYALTGDEARQATETRSARAHGEAPRGARAYVLAGVGSDTASAADAARHAQDAGAEMIMIHQPVHPYQAAAGWVDYHQAIADAVPDLGVVLYMRSERVTGAQIAERRPALPERDRDQVRGQGRHPVRGRGAGRRAWTGSPGWPGWPSRTPPATGPTARAGSPRGWPTSAPRLSLSLLGALRAGDAAGAMDTWELIRPFEDLRAADGSADNVSWSRRPWPSSGLCGRDVRPPSRLLLPPSGTRCATVRESWGVPAA